MKFVTVLYVIYRVSIHLMLRFIPGRWNVFIPVIQVSIHLMLRFIGNWYLKCWVTAMFQYISCYGLSQTPKAACSTSESFNTSHVTVYLTLTAINWAWIDSFQYISCYGLSAINNALKEVNAKFQYISCYGLSFIYPPLLSKFIWFQYISCYGLSILETKENFIVVEFQYISCYGLSSTALNPWFVDGCFNTSHVTVYRHYQTGHSVYYQVSIHLMLRFISAEAAEESRTAAFQYISCYGLSRWSIIHPSWWRSFNTSHVTVYLCITQTPKRNCKRFNTSHVTVYHM